MNTPSVAAADTSPISRAEALPLLAALVQQRAGSCNIRLLFIKGPFLAMQRIRSARDSLDLDLLLDPQAISSFLRLMAIDGWQAPYSPDTPSPIPQHAITLVHPFWPCTLDIHRFWPGFLESPAAVFNRLWACHSELPAGNTSIKTTGLADGILLCALNEIRSHGHQAAIPQLQRLAHQAQMLLSRNPDDTYPATPGKGQAASALLVRSRLLGCCFSASPFLAMMGLPMTIPMPVPPALQHWYDVVEAQGSGLRGWLIRVKRSRWYRKPLIALEALALRPRRLRLLRPETGPGFRGYLGGLLQRISQGFRGFIQIKRHLRAQHKHRR